MFGQDKIDKVILSCYGKMPLKSIAKKAKCSLHHVKYVLYKKASKRR